MCLTSHARAKLVSYTAGTFCSFESCSSRYRLHAFNTQSLMKTALQEQKPLPRPARRRPKFYDSDSFGDSDEVEPEDSDDEVNSTLQHM